MSEHTYRFDLPTHQQSIIKVMGIGGGGSNAVNNMYKRGIKGVEFVVCNTDAQALDNSPVQNKLQIGIDLTEGLGAGANPEVGKNAALESKEDIKILLQTHTKMLFITAGMGGGTGTGAAPVIAEIAKELTILTVGIITLPFAFEGKKKYLQAQEGIEQLKKHCDTVLVILNDRLREVFGNLSISNAFAEADNILTTAAKSIAEVITVPGYVNVDFEDVKTVMRHAGAAVMGSGQAAGESRALKAAEEALTSPLLDYKDIHGAKKILLSIVSGEEAELQMDELTVITDYIQEQIGTDAEMIFGHGADQQLGENIRVTVIATGFEDDHYATRSKQHQKRFSASQSEQRTQRFDNDTWAASTKKLPIQGYRQRKVRRSADKKIQTRQQVLSLPLGDDLENEKGYYHETLHDNRHMSKIEAPYHVPDKKDKATLDIPAYLRKHIQLDNLSYTTEKSLKRHHLDDEPQPSAHILPKKLAE